MSSVFQIVTQMEAGGAQGVAASLHAELRKRCDSADLVFLYRKRASHDGKGIHFLHDGRPGAWQSLKIFLRLWRTLRRCRPDCVLAHTHYSNAFSLPVAALAGVKTRIAVQHNPLYTYPRVARLADKVLGSIGIYTSIVTVADNVSSSTAAYPSSYRERVRRIYNGVPRAVPADRREARVRWNLPEDRPVLVNVGRLSRQKNQRVLIEAMVPITDAVLVIVGDGELRAELRALADDLGVSSRVRFTGEVTAADVNELLSCADAFVFSSIFEAMPLAIVEAMQHGLPIVASDIPAMREFLGDAGALVPCDVPERWSVEIADILKNSHRRQAMSAQGIERGKQFTIEAMASEYAKLVGI